MPPVIAPPEAQTRKSRIDPKLDARGWRRVKTPLASGACRTEEHETAHGPADYALFLDGKPVAIVEAKKTAVDAQNVLTQAERYARGLTDSPYDFDGIRVPFLYSTNGEQIWYRDARNPKSRSRRVADFHTPEALGELLARDFDGACQGLLALPNTGDRLRPYQRQANTATERAIAERKRSLLLAMATGTGKTFTVVNQVYRLMKTGVAKRVLFLVDRRALAAQAVRAFSSFDAEPGQKFNQVYEVYSNRFQREDFDEDEKFDPTLMPNEYLTAPNVGHAFVYVCTIQRMAINVLGRDAIFGVGDEAFDTDVDRLDIPIHAFDLIVADECHRGYTSAEVSAWRGTLDHFAAHPRIPQPPQPVRRGVVQKLWGFCHTLRHDGIDYGDYIEQITYLLFLKMADEKGLDFTKLKVERQKKVEVVDCSWANLVSQSGNDLVNQYVDTLRALGAQPGMLGDIYAGAQSRLLGVDVKAAAYEGLLEKAASEGKKGAGQYFTPRVLIQSIVRCMKPDPRKARDFTVCDPACGTGGFLVSAYEWLAAESKGGALDRDVAKRVKRSTYHGQELVPRPRRMALMNLYLHGIEPTIRLGDSIDQPPSGDRFDVILTNPPFGTKGANQNPVREDFTVATSNKQLNFVQHVLTILKRGGRAAVVLPDNCLFADQAGEVFKILTEDADLHTVLRLPRGTFTPYSQGVKANVVYFTKGRPTETVWIYDARTNAPGITKKDRPLVPAHFAEFDKCFGADPNGNAKRKSSDSKEDRWRSFPISEVKERQFKLDGFKWLKEESLDDADDLAEPEDLAGDAIEELEGAVADLGKVLALLENGNGNGKAAEKSAR
jgi:type I restriction enzyme M protein